MTKLAPLAYTGRQMTLKKIAEVARDLKKRRYEAKESIGFAEKVLSGCVKSFCDQQHAGLRDMARRMEISAPYLSDILNGRRKVSDNVIERLGRLR